MYYEMEDIHRSFEKYYKNLYSQPQASESVAVSDFLSFLDVPSVGTMQNKIITQDITDEEIYEAISRLKTGKMPGADGYPKCFNDILRGGEMPFFLEKGYNFSNPQTRKRHDRM